MAAMPDDTSASGSRTSATTVAVSALSTSKHATSSGMTSGMSSGLNSPPGHAMRRVKTMDEATSPLRTRFSARSLSSESSSMEAPPRRSSNFSEYSLGEARDILNPKPLGEGASPVNHESSPLATLSLAFALVPGVAGVLFKNGSSVATDVMLLGLAAVFLHWSVTQPWVWYHAAQEVRIQQEANTEAVIDEDSDGEYSKRVSASGTLLDDVPEEQDESKPASETNSQESQSKNQQQQAAMKELYRYEVLALLSCLILPLVSAYLLHAIRSQLSRPSEGLVSSYNLTIFLLASELRVFSHMFKLLQSRTLHLQRVVQNNGLASSAMSALQLDDVLERLDLLEARLVASEQPSAMDRNNLGSSKADVARDVRNAIQPELDALNRAVRRYEKKATLLQLQTESRFASVDARLDDAIALAAAAAKNSTARKGLLQRMVEYLVALFSFPFQAMLQIIVLPFKPILLLINRKKQQPQVIAKPLRSSRSGKVPTQGLRYSGDRIPTRVMKR